MGRAAFGAVAVGGGAIKVRLPRLPALNLGAASASPATKASVAATAASCTSVRRRMGLVPFELGGYGPTYPIGFYTYKCISRRISSVAWCRSPNLPPGLVRFVGRL